MKSLQQKITSSNSPDYAGGDGGDGGEIVVWFVSFFLGTCWCGRKFSVL